MNINVGLSRNNEIHTNPPKQGIFQNVVGQNEARKTVDFFLSSHTLQTPFPTLLCNGGHGLGKTYFSGIIAQSLNRKFLEVNSRSCETIPDFFNLAIPEIFQKNQPATILMDEAHDLKREVQTMFLSLLNPTKSGVNHYRYNGFTVEWDLAMINVVFATTDAYKINKPLRNRCQELYFYPYTDDELFHIVQGYLSGISIKCSRKELGLTCRGRARDAYVLSQNIKRQLQGVQDFTDAHLKDLKDKLGILAMGLKKSEVDLLKVIAEHGPISSSNLAIKMMVNQRNIEEEMEIRLRELGYIDNTARGRTATDQGKIYLQKYA